MLTFVQIIMILEILLDTFNCLCGFNPYSHLSLTYNFHYAIEDTEPQTVKNITGNISPLQEYYILIIIY